MSTKEYYEKWLDKYSKKLRDKRLKNSNIVNVLDKEKKYVIYARKSNKEDSGEEQKSIKKQVKLCKELATKEGYEIVGVFKEVASAKKSGAREKFDEVMDSLRKGKEYNSLLAFSPDRLARNMKDAGEIIDLLDKGIIADIQFCTYRFNNDSNGKMALAIQFALAKQYSDTLSAHTSTGMAERVKQGEAVGVKKTGYKIVNKKYAPCEKTFDEVSAIWAMALKKYPPRRIAQYLDEIGMGVLKEYKEKDVRRILKDPIYAGINIYSNTIVDLRKVHPSFKVVVTPKQFFSVQALMEERDYAHKFGQQQRYNPIVDICRCSYCGRKMQLHRAKGGGQIRKLYIACTNKDCERTKLKIATTMRAKVVIEFVEDFLSTKLSVSKDTYDKYVEMVNEEYKKEIDAFTKHIAFLKKSIKQDGDKKSNLLDKLADDNNNDLDIDISDKLKELTNNIESNKKTLEEQEKAKAILEDKKENDIATWDEYHNFFKNAGRLIRFVKYSYVLDRVVKMLFYNLRLGDKKVVFYQLNEPFKSYAKVVELPSGVEDGI